MSTKEKNPEVLNEETIDLIENKLEKIVKNYLETACHFTKDLTGKVNHSLHEAKHLTEKTVVENPLKTIGVSVLAGIALGWLLKK